MTVSPLPRNGMLILGRDRAGRALRVSTHPNSGRVVLSIWQDETCLATVRLSPSDTSDLIAGLADGLVVDGYGGELEESQLG